MYLLYVGLFEGCKPLVKSFVASQRLCPVFFLRLVLVFMCAIFPTQDDIPESPTECLLRLLQQFERASLFLAPHVRSP